MDGSTHQLPSYGQPDPIPKVSISNVAICQIVQIPNQEDLVRVTRDENRSWYKFASSWRIDVMGHHLVVANHVDWDPSDYKYKTGSMLPSILHARSRHLMRPFSSFCKKVPF